MLQQLHATTSHGLPYDIQPSYSCKSSRIFYCRQYAHFTSHTVPTYAYFTEAQVNTQEYGRRPYGVGFLVVGQDQSGPHLYEFSPSGTSYEYFAVSIGARSQSAKTYLEKHYTEFDDCMSVFSINWASLTLIFIGSLEDLIRHGLHALRETLQQDKELTIKNTSIGIIGPAGVHETNVRDEAFRILEEEEIDVYLKSMVPKETDQAPAATAPTATGGDEDVQMGDQ